MPCVYSLGENRCIMYKMTTVSVINPEVTYTESKNIDEEDIGHKSQVYELDLEQEPVPEEMQEFLRPPKTITVVIGKPKYIYTDKNIIFFPIYAVHRSKVRSQIGVFEVKSAQILNVYKNGELDLNRLSYPLYYSFSKPDYLAKLEAEPKFFEDEPLTPSNLEQPLKPKSILEKEMMKEQSPFELNIDKSRISKTIADANELLEHQLIENIEGFKPKEPLEEETKEMAEKERNEYKESSRDVWIAKYMRNNNYRIHEVESNGDCFFAVIRDAFADAGKRITVEKMRAILAAEMTDDVFHSYREVYLGFVDELDSLNRDLLAIEKTLKEYKKHVKNISDQTTQDAKELLKNTRELENEKKNIKHKIEETNELKTLYTGEIERIDTLEKMRQYIKTTSFWADTWAISTLEIKLNIKVILFSQSAFEQEGGPDLEGVILCSEPNKQLQERQTFSPDYYIMTSYSGNHYKLISYKNHKIFKFREVPYDVNILILNKCFAKLSGVYYLIQDYRNLKTKFGIDEDEGTPEDYSEHRSRGELFEPTTTFVFCSNSDPKVNPGEGSGEKILPADKPKYAKLNKFYTWRKKLDDDWDKTPIIIDSHKWTSVTHYMQGVQYKKTHPDVYLMFSLDSDPDSTLARSVKTAKAFKGVVKEAPAQETEAGKKKPKAPKKQVQVIAPDLDFDKSRQEEERTKALKAKFEDNENMRMLLKATDNALLIHNCGSGEPATPDLELMRVRKEINN